AEITLQPIRRFGFDGAILFSDILIVPYAMGQDLQFLAGEGPKLTPRLVDNALEGLTQVPERLSPIYETVRKVRAQLDDDKTMLGFAGSPWTVATYMVAGEGSRDQHDTRAMAYRDPGAFGAIIDAVIQVTVEYLCGQIEAGAEAVQLFDSWAGSLSPAQFERWVIAPNAAITAAVKARHPETPIIGFPKGSGEKLPAYARETGVDAVGIDETIDPIWAARELPQGLPVQGNLDPLLLLAGGGGGGPRRRRRGWRGRRPLRQPCGLPPPHSFGTGRIGRSHHLRVPQRGDLRLVVAQLRKDGVGMLAQHRRGHADRRRAR
ncbi:uroporphyrinogen decarboxylase, partial [Sphingomonas sp. LH128]|uniref:uroporphyrinogen decarboxylase family protein n=1 Tax=Sphingomonas sp. LH128 TaxID=473781 RepID=UPI00027CB209